MYVHDSNIINGKYRSVDEMPSHNHETAVYASNGNTVSWDFKQMGTYAGRVTTGWSSNTTFTGGGGAHNHGSTTASSPGTNSQLSTSQSILNPYITVYMWKRIS